MAPQRASRIEAWRAIWAMCAAERAIMGRLGTTSCRGGALCFVRYRLVTMPWRYLVSQIKNPWRYLVSQVLWIKNHIVPWRYLVFVESCFTDYTSCRGGTLCFVLYRLGAVESPSTPSEPHQVCELDAVSEESK
ncbi:hypothetical protein M378DRAFT_197408 [Amanita muscaria Koide BX008]|uniref:Uncharacterized protein n=1 Tax=Amanita muscaria (strain Koide BX008) TaxID=946122 RepID=A0A0C2THZ4_AMAMK|nr:hypothetical protein M378DRAFT_197408 [Amanita muscaria Koide BX008]